MNETELEDFKGYMKFLQGCCLKHPADYQTDKITSVHAFVRSENDGPSGGALFETEDGRWGAMEEWQDYTGHG